MSGLSRQLPAMRAAAPVRIVHLGLGNFFRAHQARCTDLAPDAPDWGIAAFGGRGADLAARMTAQGGLYTLVTRGPDADTFDVVASVSLAYAAADHHRWLDCLAAPDLACVTITVTEHGYRHALAGGIDTADVEVVRDLVTLRADREARVSTAPGRLVAGLARRRHLDGGPITLVPCDNLPGNGPLLRSVVLDLADRVEPALAEWVDARVSFASSMVDRITPPAQPGVAAAVLAATGYDDRCPVVTEPFFEWVLAGEFPAGRPRWEQAGVQLVDDVEPHEQRKLWLLNGAHSLLAYAGLLRGWSTVAAAYADARCQDSVRRWWAEASPYLSAPAVALEQYCERLGQRFSNPRIEYPLGQVAADGSQKIPVRVLPVLRRSRAAGEMPMAALTVLATWVNYLRLDGRRVNDPEAATVLPIVDGRLGDTAVRILDYLDPPLAADCELVAALRAAIDEWAQPSVGIP